jgi:hypothetical protein
MSPILLPFLTEVLSIHLVTAWSYPVEHETLLPSHDDPRKQSLEISTLYEHSRSLLRIHSSYRGIHQPRLIHHGLYIGLCIICLLIGFFGSYVYTSSFAREYGTTKPTSCEAPQHRREWRSLSVVERDRYIDAVLCLHTKPSRLGMNHTLYDDFAYVHYQFNNDSKKNPAVCGCTS